MAEKTEITKELVLGVIDKLSKPEEIKHSEFKEKTFKGAVPYAWSKLNFDNSPSVTVFEDFLIEMIEECYKLRNSNNDRDALKHDCSLLMFGLLRECYHTDMKTGNYVSLQERYEKYLDGSDYTKIKYPGEGSYEEIKKRDKLNPKRKKNAQPRPLNALTRTVTDCKKELSDFLYKSLIDKSYKTYIHEYNPKHEKERPSNLPSPIFIIKKDSEDLDTSSNKDTETTQNMDSSQSNDTEDATKPKESSGNNEIDSSTGCIDNVADTASSKSGSSQDEELSFSAQISLQLKAFEKLFRKLLFLMAMRTLWGAVLIVCVLLLSYYYIQYNNKREMTLADSISEENGRPEIKSIEFKYKNFLLHPGQSTELEVEIDPPEINAKELKYSSSDSSVVETDKNIITACDILDEKHCEAIITATTQNRSSVEGRVYVMVREPNSYEDMIGYGANEEALDSIYTDFQSGE